MTLRGGRVAAGQLQKQLKVAQKPAFLIGGGEGCKLLLPRSYEQQGTIDPMQNPAGDAAVEDMG
jgi:hypothetical protein